MVAIQNLSFSYSPKQQLFSQLNLLLEKGHIYGLLGKNGAGKSTLLKNMIGLAFPSSGSCTINSRSVASRPVAVLAEVYFLSEDIFVPALTPLVFAKRTGCFYPNFSLDDFMNYLKLLDIDTNAVMTKMSFGQQKKAMIAFGLATNTNLLIMDEPTNGLDIPSKTQFRKLIASVLTEERCIIISTHQVRDLDSLIDTVVVLHNRQIVVNRPLEDVTNLLAFTNTTDANADKVLYAEENVRGTKAIFKNTASQFSKPDLELLFNAIISNNQPILEILKTANNEQHI